MLLIIHFRLCVKMTHTAQLCTGEVVDLWSYGIPNDSVADTRELTFEEAQRDYKHYMHAAHAMIFSRDETVLWDKYSVMANIMVCLNFCHQLLTY